MEILALLEDKRRKNSHSLSPWNYMEVGLYILVYILCRLDLSCPQQPHSNNQSPHSDLISVLDANAHGHFHVDMSVAVHVHLFACPSNSCFLSFTDI